MIKTNMTFVRVLGIFLCTFAYLFTSAQCEAFGDPEFSAPNAAINNLLPPAEDAITSPVSGLYGSEANIVSVTINIQHTWDGDLEIRLISPEGDELLLADNIGSLNDNFTNTVFADDAVACIEDGFPPYTGTWLPGGTNGGGCTTFADAFNGVEVGGDWTLRVTDLVGGDNGVLLNWSIQFGVCEPSDEAGIVACPSDMTISLDPGACEQIVHFEVLGFDPQAPGMIQTLTSNEAEDCDALFSTTSVWCGFGFTYRFGKLYDLSDIEVGSAETVTLTSVDFGTNYSNAPTNFTVRVYSIDDGDAVLNANLTLLGTANANIGGFTATGVNMCLSAPLEIDLDGLDNLFVEIEGLGSNSFFNDGSLLAFYDAPSTSYFNCGGDWGFLADNAGLENFDIAQWLNVELVGPVPADPCGPTEHMIESGDPFPIGGPYEFCFEFGGEQCLFSITVEEYPTPISELACNNHVNISLNENCEATIGADLILEGGPYGCYDDYEVNVIDSSGADIGNVVNGEYIGHTLVVEVVDPETGNTCWGTILIEDKLPPVITCRDLTLSCTDELPTEPAPASFKSEIIETISTGGNAGGIGGMVYFNIENLTAEAVNINELGLNISTGTLVDVYIKTGTYLGFENNQGAWTLTATADATVGPFSGPFPGNGTITPAPVDFMVAPGVNGIALHTVTAQNNYTNGLMTFADDVISIQTGAAANTFFGFPFAGRSFNGYVSYEQALESIPASDNCSTEFVVTFEDEESEFGCNGDFSEIITRTWTVADESGNTSTCVSTYSRERISISEIVLPRNWDNIDTTALECGDCTEPECTGFPEGAECENINVTYEDLIIPICADNFKILRKWYILDWCTAEVLIHHQVIKILNEAGPVLGCPADVTLIGSVFDCEASFSAAFPSLDSECNPNATIADYDVSLEGPEEVVLTLQGGGYLITEIPLGIHTFTYVLVDDCGDEWECSFVITVIDKVPPTPVCDEFTVVGLTNDGTAKVFAESFDDGSHDNCGPVWFKVIRTEELCDTEHGFTGAFNSCLRCDGINANDNGVGIDPDDDLLRFGVQVYFDDFVKYCCDDIAEEGLEVTLRVYDVDPGEGPVDPARHLEGGDLYCHFNDCVVDMDAEDELPPFIVCPPDMTLECEFEFDPEAIRTLGDRTFGTVVDDVADRQVVEADVNMGFDGFVDDNCTFEIDLSVSENIECGTGVITRVFTATDQGGRTSQCVQRIFFEDETPFNEDDIDWPGNEEVSDVCLEDLMDPDTAPEYEGGVCANILVSFDDELFVQDPDACVKILRTWKVLDWCQYNENTGEGIWSHIQVIKLTNEVAPEFESCEDLFKCDSAATDCTTFISLVAIATDDCTDSLSLEYSYQIDAFYDENTPFEVDFFGSGNDASASYPFGQHLIRFTVTDGCDNSTTCEYEFDLQDCKKPSPKCFSGIVTVVMEAGGCVDIWASEFDAGSEDNCGGVVLSFSEDTSETSMTFCCEDLGSQTVEVWVTDEAGNQDFCETFLFIQDNNDVCMGDSAMIGGQVNLEIEEGVEGVEMTLENETLIQFFNAITDLDGEYSFFDNPLLADYGVEAYSNDEPTNGVSTYDIVLIQKHLLGLQEFESAYQTVAADVNNSESISALDMVELRKLLLGVYSEFPNNTSWRFVDEDQDFANIHSPWPLDERIELSEIQNSMMGEDFVAVKIGDLNNSVEPNALVESEDRSNDGSLVFEVAAADVVAGEEYRLELTSSNFDNVYGYQFTLNFDASNLEYVGYESGSLEVSANNFGTVRLNEGILTTSWSEGNGVSVESGEVLMTLVFRATRAGAISDLMSVSSQVTRAEAYTSASLDLGIELNFRTESGDVVSDEFSLYQNEPNPFDKLTKIGFTLGEAGTAQLRIHDMTGKTVMLQEGDFAKGYNEFTVTRTQLGATGVLYYTVESNDESDTKKMILID